MTDRQLRPWSQVVRLHPDVEAGDTAVATYAIDLGALVVGDRNVPLVYRRPDAFFSATHLTSGLRRLLEDVLDGLAGGKGDRVLQLRSPFGGGKSHTLAALYHTAQDRSVLSTLPEGLSLPDPGPVRVAVFDGEKFDVSGGKINGQHVQTMWGMLAAQLGCYDLVVYHDQNRIPPGGDVIADMLGDKPTLLLLDEVLNYAERTLAEAVGESTLGRLTQNFLQSLSVEVARTSHSVLVYSLQASAHEAFGHEMLLRMLDHLTSRVDAKREPVVGDEILLVLRRRLLAESPDPAAVQAAAETFATEITRIRAAHAADEAARRAAEDDRLALRDRIAAAYPFHPALIDIMTERWASLPDFQRTRGALRFLAVCLHTLKREGQAVVLLGPGDIPIEDEDVAHAFFTEVGQREPFKSVLRRDFTGPNARVKRIDERLVREHPSLSGVCPAMRIATAILAYSFGGLLRAGDEGGEPIATGVTENELLAAVIGPDLDSLTAQAVLKDLREQCLFLHYDGAHYVFKTTANVTQVIEDQLTHVKPREVDIAIEEELNNRLAGRTAAILWPRNSDAIPDREPRFLLTYLPLDFAAMGDTAREQQAQDFLAQHGERPRRYRNGLGLAVPEQDQVDPLRRAMRYLQAIKRVRGKRQSFNLTTAQMQQLKEREQAEKAKFESAIRNLYQSVWLPVMGKKGLEIEKVSLAGRPLSSQSIHERLMELLTEILPPRLFTSVTPEKIVELMRLGEGKEQVLFVSTDQVVESFYGVPGFPRLESEAALRQAIAKGVQEGIFGYVGRTGQAEIAQLKEKLSYLVSSKTARIGADLPEGRVDLSSAFIVLPQAIERETPPATEPTDQIPSDVTPTPHEQPEVSVGITLPPPGVEPRTTVRLSMRMTRQQLYASFNALANLADAAGSILMKVVAQKLDGFDPGWLRNAVLEPLDEADVKVEEEGREGT
ncbi:MAG: ATP-binding protein [Chloroflexi bacterium]|nr:ATP-binding protein [Chloroflexota bacterium]